MLGHAAWPKHRTNRSQFAIRNPCFPINGSLSIPEEALRDLHNGRHDNMGGDGGGGEHGWVGRGVYAHKPSMVHTCVVCALYDIADSAFSLEWVAVRGRHVLVR
jgi:hypothetical protein